MSNNDVFEKVKDSVHMVEFSFDGNQPQKYKKIPLTEIPFLGAGVAEIAELLKEKAIKEAKGQTPELYATVNIHGRGNMTKTKDGSGLLLGTITDEHGIVGQMRFIPYNALNDNSNVNANARAVICAVAAVGVAFYVIEQRVNSVYEELESIERSIEVKSESALVSKYKILYTVFSEFPYYAEKDALKNAKINQIVRAGDSANDIFEEYKSKINCIFMKEPNKKNIEKMMKYIYYLLASIKVFSLANYLELLYGDGDFQQGLIMSKKATIENMLDEYYEVVDKFWNYIQKQGEKKGNIADILCKAGTETIKTLVFSSKNLSYYTPDLPNSLVAIQTSENFRLGFSALEQIKYKPYYDEMMGDITIREVGLDRFDYLNELANEDNSFIIDGTCLYLLVS